MPKTRGVNAFFEEVVNERDSIWRVVIDVQGFDDSFNDGN